MKKYARLFLLALLIILTASCVTPPKPATPQPIIPNTFPTPNDIIIVRGQCRQEAAYAAMVMGEMGEGKEVRIAIGPSTEENVYHSQAQVRIGDTWKWLKVGIIDKEGFLGVYVSTQDGFFTPNCVHFTP